MLSARPPRRVRPPRLDVTGGGVAPPDPGVLCVLAGYACGELQARTDDTANNHVWQPLALRAVYDAPVCGGCGTDTTDRPTLSRVVVLPLPAPSSPDDRLHLLSDVCLTCKDPKENRSPTELKAHAARMLSLSNAPGQAGSAVRMHAATVTAATAAAETDALMAKSRLLHETHSGENSNAPGRLVWRAGVLCVQPRRTSNSSVESAPPKRMLLTRHTFPAKTLRRGRDGAAALWRSGTF